MDITHISYIKAFYIIYNIKTLKCCSVFQIGIWILLTDGRHV